MLIQNTNNFSTFTISAHQFDINSPEDNYYEGCKSNIKRQASDVHDAPPPKKRKMVSKLHMELKKNNAILKYHTERNLRQGPADIKFPNGTHLEFSYNAGVVEGKAKLQTNRSTLHFTFVKGFAQGNARHVSKLALTFFNFVAGLPQGKAFKLLPDDTRIHFEYAKGIAQGPATEFSEGRYQMQFSYLNGFPHGYAIKTYADRSSHTLYFPPKTTENSPYQEIQSGNNASSSQEASLGNASIKSEPLSNFNESEHQTEEKCHAFRFKSGPKDSDLLSLDEFEFQDVPELGMNDFNG